MMRKLAALVLAVALLAAIPATSSAAGHRWVVVKCNTAPVPDAMKTWKSIPGQAMTNPRQTSVPCRGGKFVNGKYYDPWPEQWWAIDAAESSAPVYWPGCSRDLTGQNVKQNGYWYIDYWIAC